MSTIAELKEKAKKHTELPPSQNIAFTVVGYDVERNRVNGINLTTGEEMEVFLRPLSEDIAKKLKKPRPGIANFASPRDKVGTLEGGILRADRVYFDKKLNCWSTGWLTSLSHEPGQYQVYADCQAKAHAYKDDKDDGKVKAYVDVAHTAAAIKVAPTEESLRAALVKGFVEMAEKNDRGYMVVRGSDGSDGFAFNAYQKMVDKGGDYKEPADPQVSADDFLASAVGQELLSYMHGAPEVAYEALKVERIYVVGDSLVNLQDNLDRMKRFSAPYALESGREGFTPSVVSFGRRENGSSFFTSVLPTSSKPRVVELSHLDSPHITFAADAIKAANAVKSSELADDEFDGSDFEASNVDASAPAP